MQYVYYINLTNKRIIVFGTYDPWKTYFYDKKYVILTELLSKGTGELDKVVLE